MSTGTRNWRWSMMAVAGGLALAIAGWACGHDNGGACSDGTGGASPDAGMCDDPSAPVPPKKACSCDGDIFKECPLPESVEDDSDGDFITVWYYSSPTCVAGFCHYCVTSTVTEDPNATGGP